MLRLDPEFATIDWRQIPEEQHGGNRQHVVAGCLKTELADGSKTILEAGMTYVVGTGGPAHRSSTTVETTLFIVDCDDIA